MLSQVCHNHLLYKRTAEATSCRDETTAVIEIGKQAVGQAVNYNREPSDSSHYLFLFKNITFTMKSMKWYLSGKMRPSSPSQAGHGHITKDPPFSLPLESFRDQLTRCHCPASYKEPCNPQCVSEHACWTEKGMEKKKPLWHHFTLTNNMKEIELPFEIVSRTFPRSR